MEIIFKMSIKNACWDFGLEHDFVCDILCVYFIFWVFLCRYNILFLRKTFMNIFYRHRVTHDFWIFPLILQTEMTDKNNDKLLLLSQ